MLEANDEDIQAWMKHTIVLGDCRQVPLLQMAINATMKLRQDVEKGWGCHAPEGSFAPWHLHSVLPTQEAGDSVMAACSVAL
jgi:hypothetical protein